MYDTGQPDRTSAAKSNVRVFSWPLSKDVSAEVDMNVVMSGRGLLVEVQGTAEGAPFSRGELDQMLDLAAKGIAELHDLQRQAVAS